MIRVDEEAHVVVRASFGSVWVYVSDDLYAQVTEMNQAGYSLEAQKIVVMASELGCSYVKFDSIGDIFEELPWFEWEEKR